VEEGSFVIGSNVEAADLGGKERKGKQKGGERKRYKTASSTLRTDKITFRARKGRRLTRERRKTIREDLRRKGMGKHKGKEGKGI